LSERIRSFFTYMAVFFVLLVALAIISPSQFEALSDILSQSMQLILVLIVIAVIVYALRRVERL
jgi:putative effector of murein hydrolase LrgA (UPF0299 family)